MLPFSFLKTEFPEIYRKHLISYISINVFPLYEDFLKQQLKVIYMVTDERVAIVEYCRSFIPNIRIHLPYEEVDLNDIHPIFEHMSKNIMI